MSKEKILDIEEVVEMISDAELNCISAGGSKTEEQHKATDDLVKMFGVWFEGD